MTKDEISMAYKNTFSGEHGEKVLKDLDRKYFWNSPDSCYESLSERNTCYNLGKLTVIRYIHGQIDKNLTKTEDKKAVHKEI